MEILIIQFKNENKNAAHLGLLMTEIFEPKNLKSKANINSDNVKINVVQIGHDMSKSIMIHLFCC